MAPWLLVGRLLDELTVAPSSEEKLPWFLHDEKRGRTQLLSLLRHVRRAKELWAFGWAFGGSQAGLYVLVVELASDASGLVQLVVLDRHTSFLKFRLRLGRLMVA